MTIVFATLKRYFRYRIKFYLGHGEGQKFKRILYRFPIRLREKKTK